MACFAAKGEEDALEWRKTDHKYIYIYGVVETPSLLWGHDSQKIKHKEKICVLCYIVNIGFQTSCSVCWVHHSKEILKNVIYFSAFVPKSETLYIDSLKTG